MFIVYWFSVWYSHSLLFHFSAHRRKWTIPEILLVYKLPYVHTSYHAHISVLPCLITCYVHTSYHTHISVLLCLLTSYVHTPATPISQFSHVCSPVMSTPLPRPHLSSPMSAHLLCSHPCHTHISVLCLFTCYVHTPATPISQFCVCSPVMSTPPATPISQFSHVFSPVMSTPLPRPHPNYTLSVHLLRMYVLSPCRSQLPSEETEV